MPQPWPFPKPGLNKQNLVITRLQFKRNWYGPYECCSRPWEIKLRAWHGGSPCNLSTRKVEAVKSPSWAVIRSCIKTSRGGEMLWWSKALTTLPEDMRSGPIPPVGQLTISQSLISQHSQQTSQAALAPGDRSSFLTSQVPETYSTHRMYRNETKSLEEGAGFKTGSYFVTLAVLELIM